MAFAELCITSNFTFLTGGSHPQEYALRAIELGLPAFAIADRNSVAGLVRAHQELREAARAGRGGPAPRPGGPALPRRGGPELTALPRDRAGWGRLCRLLSAGGACGRRRASACSRQDDLDGLGAHAPPPAPPPPGGRPRGLAAAGAGARPAAPPGRTWWRARATTARTAARIDAGGAARRASSACRWSPRPSRSCTMARRRRLVDVLTCIREGRRIDTIGRAAQPTPSGGCARRPRCCGSSPATRPRCTARARSPTDCGFALDELRYEYPREIWDGEDPQARLARLTARGCAGAIPAGVPEKVAGAGGHTSWR